MNGVGGSREGGLIGATPQGLDFLTDVGDEGNGMRSIYPSYPGSS